MLSIVGLVLVVGNVVWYFRMFCGALWGFEKCLRISGLWGVFMNSGERVRLDFWTGS